MLNGIVGPSECGQAMKKSYEEQKVKEKTFAHIPGLLVFVIMFDLFEVFV